MNLILLLFSINFAAFFKAIPAETVVIAFSKSIFALVLASNY